jgi:hypothetical protein
MEKGNEGQMEFTDLPPEELAVESAPSDKPVLERIDCQYCQDVGLCQYCDRGHKETAEFKRESKRKAI